MILITIIKITSRLAESKALVREGSTNFDLINASIVSLHIGFSENNGIQWLSNNYGIFYEIHFGAYCVICNITMKKVAKFSR
jgi:hypothetical protein